MDDVSYQKMYAVLQGVKKIEKEAKSFLGHMLNQEFNRDSQVGECVSVLPVDGSDFDFQIRCDQRKILAHYSRFNNDEGNYINPFGRYQFHLYTDALPGAEFETPKLLLQIEFGRAGEFKLEGQSLSCSPSDFYQAQMRNLVLVAVIGQLQKHIYEGKYEFITP